MNLRQLKAQAKQMLRERWGKLACCTFFCLFISALLSGQSLVSNTRDVLESSGFSVSLSFWDPLRPWFTLVYVAFQILGAFLLYGYWDQFIKTRIGLPVGMKAMCKRFVSMPGKIIGATCVNLALTIGFGLLVFFLGLSKFTALLALPVLLLNYFLKIRLAMVPLILLENPYTTVPEALVQSYNVMRGNTWRFLVLQLSFIGWLLLGICTFGIGLFWVLPYLCMTTVNFYYDSKARKLNQQ